MAPTIAAAGDLAHSAGLVLGLESLAQPLTLMLVLGIGLFVVILGLGDQRILLAAAFLLYGAQMFHRSVLPPNPNAYATAGLICVMLIGMVRRRLPRFEVLRSGLFPATAIYWIIAVGLLGRSADIGESVKSLVLVVYAMAFCWFVLSACEPDEIRAALRWCTGVIVLGSLALLVLQPSKAISGYELEIVADRWRGLTQNPNTLATFAALFFLFAGSVRMALASLVPAVLIFLGTASRTPVMALAVIGFPTLLRGRSVAIRRTLIGAALLVILPLLILTLTTESGPVDITNQTLIRTTNTRQDSWEGAIDAIGQYPVGGLGIGNDYLSSDERIPVSSSYLRPIVELGWPGVLPLIALGFVAVRAVKRSASVFRTVFAFMLIHGILEGWLYAGGSLLFVIFVVAASAMEFADRRPPDELDESGEPDLVGAGVAV